MIVSVLSSLNCIQRYLYIHTPDSPRYSEAGQLRGVISGGIYTHIHPRHSIMKGEICHE
jgi:hypothetical protein